MFAILLLLSKVSRVNDNNGIDTISSAFDTILNEKNGFVRVVLVVLIMPPILFCALAIPICTSARWQPIIFANTPTTGVHDNTVSNNGYGEETTCHGSNLETIDWLSLKTFDLGTFDTIGTVFAIFIQLLILAIDILVCTILNAIEYWYEKK